MGDHEAALPESGSSAEIAQALATLTRLSKGANYRVVQEDTAKRLARCQGGPLHRECTVVARRYR